MAVCVYLNLCQSIKCNYKALFFFTSAVIKKHFTVTRPVCVSQGCVGWPVSVICSSSLPDIESVTEALKSGPYGRCVYQCDNDVCTNQVRLTTIWLAASAEKPCLEKKGYPTFIQLHLL